MLQDSLPSVDLPLPVIRSDDSLFNNSDLFGLRQSRLHLFLKRCLKFLITLISGGLLYYFIVAPLIARKINSAVTDRIDEQAVSLDQSITNLTCSELHTHIGLNTTYCKEHIASFILNTTKLVEKELKQNIQEQYDTIKLYVFLLAYTAFVTGVFGGYGVDKGVSFTGNLYTGCKRARNAERLALNVPTVNTNYQATI